MSIFPSLKHNKGGNPLNTCSFLLKGFHVKCTKSKLDQILQDHIEYPSILSVKDCLFEYGIQSAAIRKGDYSYSDFEIPFVCSIQRKEWPLASFTVVTDNNDGFISYLDPLTNAVLRISIQEFELIDKGIILLIDGSQKRDEIGYLSNKVNERTKSMIGTMPLYLVLIMLLISAGFLLFKGDSDYYWIGLGFLINSFIGLCFSALLTWHEVDAHNPFLKEVCGGAKKTVNCEAVLNSSKSKFLGISWALWGFSFMSTLFFTQILFANQLPNLIITSLLSIIVTPYIAFSVYYQARNRQWCRLCLGVQVILAINAVLAFIMLKNSLTIFAMLDYYTISTTVFLGLVFLLLGCHAVPILKKAFDSKNYEKRLRRLRYNPDIFQALLNNNPLITKSIDGVGLVVGNPQATTELIKVCNPYCDPCSKAHPHLEEIIKGNPDVKIRIIFTASGEDEDIKTAPVAHLLAVQDKQGQAGVEQALNDWYLASRKDYGSFAAKYPMNGEIKAQKEKIIAMRNWCNDMKIRATPTLFINGRELPEGYAISELKNFF